MKKIISRRDFIIMSGLSSVALTAGIGTANYFNRNKINSFSLYGFIPDDENILRIALALVRKKIGNVYNILALSEEKRIKNLVKNEYKKPGDFSDIFPSSKIIFHLQKLNNNVKGDIILSDSENIIYSPDKDFSNEFLNFRETIKNKKADLLLRVDFHEKKFFSFLNPKKRISIIENENGEVDRIDLQKNYKNISIPGPQGKTEIEINNGIIKVNKSTCSHEICKKMSASFPGDVIACAPNKVLIRIDSA